MDTNKGIPVTVRRVEPESEYEGTVFHQTVIVELPDGSEMGLFDKDVLVSSEMVGKEKHVLISMLTSESGFDRTAGEEKGVRPNKSEPLSWNKHVYCGSVDQIVKSTDSLYKVLLDVGIGHVIVRPTKQQFPDLTISDTFAVTASRSDVYDIEDSV